MEKKTGKSLEDKVDAISEQLHKMDKDLALQQAAFVELSRHHELLYQELKRSNDILKANTDSLREHMHRTELLEDLANKMDGRLSPIEKRQIEEDAVRKHKHETLVRWGKILAALVAFSGLLMWAKPLLLKLLLP
jgi:hypothetical protein